MANLEYWSTSPLYTKVRDRNQYITRPRDNATSFILLHGGSGGMLCSHLTGVAECDVYK